MQRLLSQTLDRFGRLDHVVNNGGGQLAMPAADMSLKGWTAVVETNLTGPFLVSREAYVPCDVVCALCAAPCACAGAAKRSFVTPGAPGPWYTSVVIAPEAASARTFNPFAEPRGSGTTGTCATTEARSL